jgi:hypothetical protein
MKNKYALIGLLGKMALIAGLIFGAGCKTNYDLDFKVNNNSSTDIQVKFYSFENGDTGNVQINSGQTQSIWIVPSELVKGNWYYDYNISIKYITNSNGDTIHFDPNESYWWHTTNHSRVLEIYNSSF